MGGTPAFLSVSFWTNMVLLLFVFRLAECVVLPSDPQSPHLVCEHEELTVQNGSDVILRARLLPPQDLTNYTLDIKIVGDNRETVPDDIVHSYRNGHDHPQKPRKDSSNSTLSHADLRTGTITLALKSLHLSARRNYKVYIPRLRARCYVTLRVDAEKKDHPIVIFALVAVVVIVVVTTLIGYVFYANRRRLCPSAASPNGSA